ncbi:MAG TPA: xanthine dehydrogenase family protein molybdopterin-binding subunit [Candidatus Limnocylindrales bacterium]|nr:xanthine dehydrogenase family protein molybdopterin-binding subunit [Candidatus Limnocylindrales bacterium]
MTLRLEDPEVRIEGLDKVTGVARYTDDREVPGSLVVRYRYAGIAHGRIRRIDTRRAEAVDGVQAVLTGRDTVGLRAGRRLQDWPLLAWDRVRFPGERVAAVAAETEQAADAAVAAIEVEYEELPAVFDPAAALAPDSPVLHPDAASYRYLGASRPATSHPNIQGELVARKGPPTDGALETVLAGAAIFVEESFSTGRQHQGYIEPHASAVVPGPDGRVQVITTNKAPFSLRLQLSTALDTPTELVEVDSAVIGGDFGGKGLSIDEYVLIILARRTGRPVRFVAAYDEELRAYAPRHGGSIRLRTGLEREGRIVAHAADLLFDGGAYAGAKPLPELILPGGLDVMAPYDVPALRIVMRTVYTNSVPGGHMRCPGELQAAFASESHVDRLAAAVGLDPVEFRRRNIVREGSVSVQGERIRQPMAAEVLDALASGAPAGLPSDHGFGVALVARRMEGGRQSVTLRAATDGRVEILTGLPDQGAGVHTMLARVVARTLGTTVDRVVSRQQTTATASQDLGVGASRVTFIASRAAQRAAEQLRAALGEPSPAEWEAALVQAAAEGLEVIGSFDSTAEGEADVVDFTFAAMGVVASVDRETGAIRIVDATIAADSGTVINPIAHRGQIEGGFAQGLGAALMEELLIDEGIVSTQTLADYRLPTATDVPTPRIVLLTGAPGSGAFGAKMAGELSPSPVAPAIANAVEQAVGVRIRRIPMTPERVLAALRGRSADGVDLGGNGDQ